MAELGLPPTDRLLFRVFLTDLGVPQVQIGSTAYVDSLTFYVAMKAILLPFQPTYLSPWARRDHPNLVPAPLKRDKKKPARPITKSVLDYRIRLSPESFSLLKKEAEAALLYARKVQNLTITDAAITQATQDVAARMRTFLRTVPLAETIYNNNRNALLQFQESGLDVADDEIPPPLPNPVPS